MTTILCQTNKDTEKIPLTLLLWAALTCSVSTPQLPDREQEKTTTAAATKPHKPPHKKAK